MTFLIITSLTFIFFIFTTKLGIEFNIIVLLAYLHPVGEWTQQFPQYFPFWIRWYLSDIGWVPMFAVFGACIYFPYTRHKNQKLTPSSLFIWSITTAYFLTALALLNEGFDYFMTGKLDIIDCSIFIVMVFVTKILLSNGHHKGFNMS